MISRMKTTPPRLISARVELKTKADEQLLRDALHIIDGDDPYFSFTIDPASGEKTIHSVNELHLDAAIDKLVEHGVGVDIAAPQVEYRETLERATEVDFTHGKRVVGNAEFARVKLALEPNKTNKGNVFASTMADDTFPQPYMCGVEKGVNLVLQNGVLIGFPLVDVKITFLDGSYDEDSSEIAFEIAARAAMKQGLKSGGIKLLEPVMEVQVVSPSDSVGSILRYLDASRAIIHATATGQDGLTVIKAEVPLANLFGFLPTLNSLSDGRASYGMTFSSYQEVPKNIAPDPSTFPPAIGMRA